MITTNNTGSSIRKCSRCGKSWKVSAFGYHLAPMCHKCHTFQTLCEDCEKEGCINCGTKLGLILY